LESDLNKIALNIKFDIIKEPRINAHNETIIDTVKTLTYNDSKIYLYRSTVKEWIYEAKIRSSEFVLLEKINIGVEKKALEKILKTELISDITKIGNLENTSVFIFTFKSDKLIALDYQGWID